MSLHLYHKLLMNFHPSLEPQFLSWTFIPFVSSPFISLMSFVSLADLLHSLELHPPHEYISLSSTFMNTHPPHDLMSFHLLHALPSLSWTSFPHSNFMYELHPQDLDSHEPLSFSWSYFHLNRLLISIHHDLASRLSGINLHSHHPCLFVSFSFSSVSSVFDSLFPYLFPHHSRLFWPCISFCLIPLPHRIALHCPLALSFRSLFVRISGNFAD